MSLLVKTIGTASLFVKTIGMASLFVKPPKLNQNKRALAWLTINPSELRPKPAACAARKSEIDAEIPLHSSPSQPGKAHNREEHQPPPTSPQVRVSQGPAVLVGFAFLARQDARWHLTPTGMCMFLSSDLRLVYPGLPFPVLTILHLTREIFRYL